MHRYHENTFLIRITGLVQGVGFRPFIYRLAATNNLKGWVENRSDGVLIKVNANPDKINNLKESILKEAPPASDIESIDIQEIETEIFNDFRIKKSESLSSRVTEISPDIAVCEDCINDMQTQDHRIDYPFINCTNCGPRFTIIKGLPYDRPKTTMDEFEMCPICRSEYENMLDRRFHAQPVACNHCGPVYLFTDGVIKTEKLDEILNQVVSGLDQGKVFAMKGMGGFHLLCDALNNEAVKKIRDLKQRDGKPFAVMFKSIEGIRKFAYLDEVEQKALTSWRRPIVLLDKKKDLAFEVCNGLSTIGVMLPYMPFHYLLFDRLTTPVIVLTSGNITDEPIILSNNEAADKLKNNVDGFITYNRKIHNRTDDSVMMIVNKKQQIIRRSRGFTPQPIRSKLNTEGIFAAGAELVNSFCIGKGQQVILSQFIGDLKNFETYEFYKESYKRFSAMLNYKPDLIVRDLHPDYLSSQFADQLAAENSEIKSIKVQHHHAHIASAMMDHGLDENVIGVSFDGIGLGTDGKIWGAEFFNCCLTEYERLYHFEYVPMPGGDKATREPWRMAVAYLYQTFGSGIYDLPLPLFQSIEKQKIDGLIHMMEKQLNSPLASSTGRLFDAVAAITGIIHHSTFHAEAPMRLESIIASNIADQYSYTLNDKVISFQHTIEEIVSDIKKGIESSIIAAKFHNTIIRLVFDMVDEIRNHMGLNTVVLSGGSFQNKYITSRLEQLLTNEKFKVYLPESIPANDQGIAVGQIAIAAKMRELGMI